MAESILIRMLSAEKRGGDYMVTEIIVGVLSFFGTLVGTFGGIMTSAKLTNYRIEQLEIKVDRHTSFTEKIPLIEQRVDVLENRCDKLERKVDELEQ